MGTSASKEQYKSPASTVDAESHPDDKSIVSVEPDPPQTKKEEIYLLKRLFYKLDPAVIKDVSETIYGQIKLSLKYVSEQELLLIKVFEVRHLTTKSVRGHSFDPYIKIELVRITGEKIDNNVLALPENAPKYTSAATHASELSFNEIFSFKVGLLELEEFRVRFSVWSSYGLDQDDFFGEIYLDILKIDCIDNVQTAWHDLQAQTDISIGGELHVNLSYKWPQTLVVTVNSATGVKQTSQDTTAMSVRVFIPGVPYVFRTTPVLGTQEHVWIETFSFPVPKEELMSRKLILVVTDANEDDSYLGECHIALEDLDITRGFEGTVPLADMRGSNVVRSRWSRNAVTQELQEALHAHAVCMRPQFLFDPKSSKTKALSVDVPKAFVHSHMRVVNGVVVQ